MKCTKIHISLMHNAKPIPEIESGCLNISNLLTSKILLHLPARHSKFYTIYPEKGCAGID